MKWFTSQDFFEKYQTQLLYVLNDRKTSWLVRKYLKIEHDKEIIALTPEANHIYLGKRQYQAIIYSGEFYRWKLKNLEKILKFGAFTISSLINPLLPLVLGDSSTINSSTGDGRVIINNAVWATARSATTGDSTDSFGNVGANQDSNDANKFNIFRGFTPFDTSSLGAGATVSATDLKLGIDSFDDTAGDNSICVILTTQASITALVTDDYDNLTLNSPAEGAARTTFASLTADAYKTISLNATGVSWVNPASSTKLGLRNNYDVDNTTPAAAAGSSKNRVRFRTTAGAELLPPQLVITYTPAGGAGFLSKLALMGAG